MKFSYTNKEYWLRMWRRLVGDPKEFSMENRAFNSISIISLALLLIILPFNYIIGLYDIVRLVVVIIIAQTFFYYLARVKRKFNVSIPLYVSVAYGMIILNYFLNSGSLGPSFMLFIMVYVLLTALTPKRQLWMWIVIHIFSMSVLLAIEYNHPNAVPDTYKLRRDRYIDLASSFIVVILCIHMLIAYMRKNYDEEKNLAEKNAREVELQNKKLEQINAEKNKLFSIISHDLRAPLTSIQAYIELLSSKLLNEEEKEGIERQLLQLTNSTTDMLSNLLSWSKAQMEGVSVQLAPHNLHNIVEQAIQVQRTLSAKKNIIISASVDPHVQLMADKNMLELVIRNLVNNAVKFSPHNSQIFVTGFRRFGQVEITIKDSGVGIPPDVQEKIFTPRVPSSKGTNEEKGVGLGLLLCKEFTEMQNGSIWFESVPGEGSVFHLTFPFIADLN